MAEANSQLDRLLVDWARARDGFAPERRDGHYVFVFDGEYEVELSQDGSRMLMRSELEMLPADIRLANMLIERVLSIHLGRSMAGEEIVTVEPEGKRLILFRELPVPESVTRFSEAIGAFVNAAAFWTRRLRAEIATETAPRGPQMRMMYP
ncbi:MAG: hypothetical protein AAGG47_01535 [Pseudomonadota bacterium]